MRPAAGLSALPRRGFAAHAGDMLDSMVLESTGVDADRSAALFASLADPARLRILAVLADTGRCVCDIRRAVPIAANLLSYHLRVLREAGLIEGSRRGRWIDYHLAADSAALVARALHTAGFDAVVDQPAGCSDSCEVDGR
jgi:ArsR family transcriptional regulator, arsenate/arsenite/antimonite-responsive transcriptional repressor